MRNGSLLLEEPQDQSEGVVSLLTFVEDHVEFGRAADSAQMKVPMREHSIHHASLGTLEIDCRILTKLVQVRELGDFQDFIGENHNDPNVFVECEKREVYVVAQAIHTLREPSHTMNKLHLRLTKDVERILFQLGL